jgi:hypothetical protein
MIMVQSLSQTAPPTPPGVPPIDISTESCVGLATSAFGATQTPPLFSIF